MKKLIFAVVVALFACCGENAFGQQAPYYHDDNNACNTSSPITTFPYTWDFNDALSAQCWNRIDNDEDEVSAQANDYSWWIWNQITDNTSDHRKQCARNKTGGSWISYSYVADSYAGESGWELGLDADNWLVSPAISLPCQFSSATIRFYIKSVEGPTVGDALYVYLSTGNLIEDTVQRILSTTASQGGEDEANWQIREVGIEPQYAGQTIHIVFRHKNYSNSGVAIDDVSIDIVGASYGDTVNIDTSHCTPLVWNSEQFASDTTIQTTISNGGCNTVQNVNIHVWPEYQMYDTVYLRGVTTFSLNGINANFNENENPVNLSHTANGCDSAFFLHLVQLSPQPENLTACGGSITIGGNTYTEDASIVDTVKHTENGITYYDTLTAYDIHILPAGQVVDSSIEGSSFTYLGQTYRHDATFADPNNTCDSIHFVVLYPVADVITRDTSLQCLIGGSISDILQNDTTHLADHDSIHITLFQYRPAYNIDINIDTLRPFVWNGNTYTEDGTYTAQLRSIHNCDSTVTLHLHITGDMPMVYDTVPVPAQNIGGCDTLAIQGHVFRATRTEAYDTTISFLTNHAPHDTLYTYNIHFNISFHQYDTVTYTAPYFYHDRSFSTPGNHIVYPLNCDTTFHLNLTIVDALPCDTSYGPTQRLTGCDQLLWEGTTYRRDTRLYDTLVNAVGCDSIRQVQIIIHRSFKDSTFFRPDAGSTYTWAHNGAQFTANGTYYDSLTDRNGCDSIYAITLRWRLANCVDVYGEFDTSACGQIVWNGQTYTTPATLTDTLVSIDECDSIRTVRLNVKHESRRFIDTSGCEFLWYNGYSYRESIDETTLLGTLANGCDSSERLRITINHNTNYIDTFTACERFRFETTVFTHTQDYIGNPRTNSQGCDSNINLHIIIIHNVSRDTQATACDSLLWANRYYTASGNYTHTDSAANGCDSTTTLHLTINQSTHIENTVSACDFYNWYGETYDRSGVYNMQTTGDNGCPLHEAIRLTILHSTSVRIDTSACDFLAWHANYFRTDTTATFVTTNHVHCDSIQYLTLHIRHSSNTQRSVTACDSYLWHDSLFRTTTDYTHHGTNYMGCDSATTLHLTIVHSDTLDTIITACNSLRWNDSTYTASTIDTFRVDDGNCRGAEILHLTLGRTTSNRLQQNVCDSLRWHDSTYTVSTTDMHTFTSAEGCDSMVTLALFVRYSTHSVVNAAECNHYTWHGITYTESTDTASFRRYNHAGCDSIVHLHLIIRHEANVIDTIRACEQYSYNNRVFTEDGIIGSTRALTIYGCDSLTTLYLSIYHNGDSIAESKTVCNTYVWDDGHRYNNDTVVYRAVENAGCTTTHVLRLTVNHDLTLHDTIQACNEYIWSGRLYNYSTTETLTGTTREGCTQRNVLHLTIHNDHQLVIDTAVCTRLVLAEGIAYDANVTNLRRSLGPTVHGCDSSLLLTLRINGRYNDTTLFACNSVSWNGTTYLQSQDIIDTTPLASGCDSIYAVRIIVAYPSTSIDVLQACDSITWRNGTTYYENTLLVDTVHIIDGCDSIIYLSLKMDSAIHNETYEATNREFEWDNKTYNVSGDYTHTYTAANGCDSTMTVHLTVTNLPNPMVMTHDQCLLMVNHYPFGESHGRVDYYGYRWYCNGTPIEGATSDSYSLITGGLLNGCFYVEAAVNEELTAWLSSNLTCVGNYGIDDIKNASLSFTAYPNPAEAGSLLHLATTLDNSRLQGATLDLFDHQGRTLLSLPYQQSATGLAMPATSGIYLLRLTTSDGLILATRIIVR